jgi:hypothetical protein
MLLSHWFGLMMVILAQTLGFLRFWCIYMGSIIAETTQAEQIEQ